MGASEAREDLIGGSGKETLLIVDDEVLVRRVLAEELHEGGYKTEAVDSLGALRQRLGGAPTDGILLDLQLPDGHGLDILPSVRTQWPDVPVIVMTGHGSIELAVRAIRMGATNFVQKPLNADELILAIRQAIETNRLRKRAEDERIRNSDKYAFDRIIAQSPAMQEVLDQARIVADSRATTVLLLGESGTGKGLLAGAIHFASSRAEHPFLPVMCSAIPEALLEAEMFGHERGAFTDAKQRRRGVFEAADGGTVFLDEIGDMPTTLQAKLLGIIEDRTFARVGGTARLKADVRIVAATHRDLNRAVEDGRFREDLLYRLQVVPIILPALRDRPEDILPMAETFLEEFAREFGREVDGFDDSARAHLAAHTWPGNVRELRNVIERAMLFTRSNVISASELLIDMGYRPRTGKRDGPGSFTLPPDGVRLGDVQDDLIRQAMQRAANNQSRAAALLGISRDKLRYRLEKLGLLPAGRRRRDAPEQDAGA